MLQGDLDLRQPAGIAPGADRVELHGLSPIFADEFLGACNVSNDGRDIGFPLGPHRDGVKLSRLRGFISQYRDKGCLIFLWWAGPQGRISPREAQHSPFRRILDIRSIEVSAIAGLISDKAP